MMLDWMRADKLPVLQSSDGFHSLIISNTIQGRQGSDTDGFRSRPIALLTLLVALRDEVPSNKALLASFTCGRGLKTVAIAQLSPPFTLFARC